MKTLAFIVCATLLAATSATAERRQHGNIVYDLPPDWSTGRLENGVQTLICNGPEEVCDFCYVYFGPGAEATGDLAGWLAEQSLLFADEDDLDSVEVYEEAKVVSTDPRDFAMMFQEVGGDLQVLFALEASGRYEIVAFEGGAYDEEETAQSLAFLQSDVTGWIDSLRYVSEGTAPLMPDPVPGGMAGLWYGWHQSTTFGIDMVMQLTVEHRRLVFWPDGHFYDGTPPSGLQPIDPAALAAAYDADWGIYRERPGVIELTYVDGRTERLTADGDGWADGDSTLTLVEPLADGTMLDGTISSFSFTGFTPGTGMSGGVSSSSSTTFFPNGTYEGESFGGAFGGFSDGFGNSTGGFATDSGVEANGGTYKVRGGLLIMRPADGGPLTSEFIHPVDDSILIGDEFLETE